MANPASLNPPYEADNKVAVRHGMHSESLVNLKADELRPRVLETAPWVADPSFSGTLEQYCRALATALMGLEYIAEVSAEKGCGKVAPRTIETCNGMLNSAARLGTLLGLDPKAEAVIQSLTASTSSLAALKRLTETGARTIAKRKAELAAEAERTTDRETPQRYF